MKQLFLVIFLFAFAITMFAGNEAESTYPSLQLPGNEPLVFAAGSISLKGRYEYALSISPDGKTILFTTEIPNEHSAIYMLQKQKNKWSTPKKISFTGNSKTGEMEAFFTADGRFVHFAVTTDADCSIWKTNWKGNNWSKPSKLDGVINTGIVFFPVATDDNTLYFTNVKEGKTYYATLENGVYKKSQPLDIAFGGHAFVTKDNRTLVMDSGGDLYACFKLPNDVWSHPLKLDAAISTSNFNETCPSLSPDGKFLFFSRYNEENEISDIYWVATDSLEKLKEKVLSGWQSNADAQAAWNTVRTINKLWAIEKKADSLQNYFHPQMVFIHPGGLLRREGSADIINNYREYVKTIETIYFKENDPLVQVYNNGSTAVVTYYYDFMIKTSAAPKRFTGRDMYILVKENGAWLAVADQFSASPK